MKLTHLLHHVHYHFHFPNSSSHFHYCSSKISYDVIAYSVRILRSFYSNSELLTKDNCNLLRISLISPFPSQVIHSISLFALRSIQFTYVLSFPYLIAILFLLNTPPTLHLHLQAPYSTQTACLFSFLGEVSHCLC